MRIVLAEIQRVKRGIGAYDRKNKSKTWNEPRTKKRGIRDIGLVRFGEDMKSDRKPAVRRPMVLERASIDI